MFLIRVLIIFLIVLQKAEILQSSALNSSHLTKVFDKFLITLISFMAFGCFKLPIRYREKWKAGYQPLHDLSSNVKSLKGFQTLYLLRHLLQTHLLVMRLMSIPGFILNTFAI